MQAEVLQQVEIEPQAAALVSAQSQAAVLRQQAAEAAMRAEIAQQAAVVLAEEASEVLTKATAAKARAEEVAAAGQDAHELQITANLWQSWQAQVSKSMTSSCGSLRSFADISSDQLPLHQLAKLVDSFLQR